MRYIKLIVPGIAILLSFHASAQVQEKVKIEAVTVFLQGAELTSTAKVNLPAGETEVVFTNIAGQLDERSINVATDKEVTILSATFRTDYLSPEHNTPRAKELKDSIQKIEDRRSIAEKKVSVLNVQIGAIENNNKIAGTNNGLSVAELQKYLDLVGAKLETLYNERVSLTKQEEKLDEIKEKLTNQLAVEQQKNEVPGGQLIVKFYSKNDVSLGVLISYVSPDAGWSPHYDLRVAQLDKPIALLYKANVHQNSGIKWDNVRLTLSTGNPAEGGQSPVLNPIHLSFYTPPVVAYDKQSIQRMPSSSVNEMAATSSGVYQSKSALSIQGARSEGTTYTIDEGISEVTDNAGVNTSFDIDVPYTVPGDGQNHMLTIKSFELPATYRYYAVPKLDKDAFLQAQATNWEDLNLLPGKANIFYDGAFVGESTIDTRNVKDTMTFSLGRDKKVIVKREQDQKLHSVKMIGANQRESFAYTISVRNTRKQPIDLVIADQLPVSNDNDISIEDVDTNGGSRTETTGEVKWTLHLNANETRDLKLSYTVKYPKGRIINGLR